MANSEIGCSANPIEACFTGTDLGKEVANLNATSNFIGAVGNMVDAVDYALQEAGSGGSDATQGPAPADGLAGNASQG